MELHSSLLEHWWVYALLCERGGIYVGVSPTPAERTYAHFAGKGALYTQMNVPLVFLWAIEFPNQATARRWEAISKKLTRSRKFEVPGRFLSTGSHFIPTESAVAARWDVLSAPFRHRNSLLEQAADLPVVLSMRPQ